MQAQTGTAFTIPLGRLVAIIASAVIAGGVSGVFGFIRIANSDHYAIVANAARIEAIESNYVSKDVVALMFDRLETKVDNNSKYLEEINRKLDK